MHQVRTRSSFRSARRRWLVAALAPLLTLAPCLAPSSARASSGDGAAITYIANPPAKLAYAASGPLAFPPPSVCEAQLGLA